MSRNPGIAVFSMALSSVAPAGRLNPPRGPTASMTSSRIKIPASLISEVGVIARPAWIRVVGMTVQHRSGNAWRDKTKRADQTSQSARSFKIENALRLLAGHVDASQFERVAIHRALDGHVMAGVRRYLVLRIDHVHFLVGVVHEHVLGAMFLDALDRALRRTGLIIRAFRAALAIRDPAGHRAVCRQRKRAREERSRNCR